MARPVHRDTARHFLVGVIGVVVVAAVAGLGALVSSGGEVPAQTYTYAKVEFTDVGTLKVRQDVRQNSLIIGQVSDIRREGDHALVTLRLNGEHPVYSNASAKIWNESALSKQLIELNPGTKDAGPLGDGTIPRSRTENAIQLDNLLDVLDKPTRDGLATGVQELGHGLLGHTEDLRDALHAGPRALNDLGQISEAATSKEANLPALLNTANRVVGRLDGRREELRGLLEQANTTLDAVNVDDTKPLTQTLRDLPPTLTDARETLDSLNGPLGDLQSTVTTIRPGAQALGRSASDLRGVLREGVQPLRKVPRVADKAEPAVSDLTETVADARPLAPPLLSTLDSANGLLSGLAPYAYDAGRFFSELAAPHGLLSGSIAPGQHYFRAIAAAPAGPGLLSLPDPTARRIPYPQPGGGAYKHAQPPDEGGNG